MNKDEQVVTQSDLAIVVATEVFIGSTLAERAQLRPALDEARAAWAAARYRLLFPDPVAVQDDIDEAIKLRLRIEQAADKQVLAQALLDLAGLLLKFAH